MVNRVWWSIKLNISHLLCLANMIKVIRIQLIMKIARTPMMVQKLFVSFLFPGQLLLKPKGCSFQYRHTGTTLRCSRHDQSSKNRDILPKLTARMHEQEDCS